MDADSVWVCSAFESAKRFFSRLLSDTDLPFFDTFTCGSLGPCCWLIFSMRRRPSVSSCLMIFCLKRWVHVVAQVLRWKALLRKVVNCCGSNSMHWCFVSCLTTEMGCFVDMWFFIRQKNLDWSATIRLEHPAVEVYSARVDFTAKFKGIQFLLYQWPIFSFLVGTSVFFLPLLFLVGLTAYFCLWKQIFKDNRPIQPDFSPNRRTTTRQRSAPDARSSSHSPDAAEDQAASGGVFVIF